MTGLFYVIFGTGVEQPWNKLAAAGVDCKQLSNAITGVNVDAGCQVDEGRKEKEEETNQATVEASGREGEGIDNV